jgi:hypothetical protein
LSTIRRAAWVFYWFICVALYMAYVGLALAKKSEYIMLIISTWASSFARDDVVLRWIVFALIWVIVLVLIPGFLAVSLGALAVIAALMAINFYYGWLIPKIAAVSSTGFVIAAILAVSPPVVLMRNLVQRYGRLGNRIFGTFGMAVYGIFFDWWLTPLIRRRKGRQVMDDFRKKSERSEQAVAKLTGTDITDLTSSAPRPDDTWIERLIYRFHIHGQQKNYEAQTKMAAAARQCHAETRGAIDEFRGVLNASDDLERVRRGDIVKEKDEEAEIRGLERTERKLTIEKKITDLKKGPEQPSPAPKRESMGDRLARSYEEEEREKAKYSNNPKIQEDLRLHYEDERMKIKEGR